MNGYEDIISKVVAGIITSIFAIIGYTIKSIKQEILAVETRIHAVEVDIPKTYLSKADFVHAEDRLFLKLGSLETKLDSLIASLRVQAH